MNNFLGMEDRLLLPRWVPTNLLFRTLTGKKHFEDFPITDNSSTIEELIKLWSKTHSDLIAIELINSVNPEQFYSEEIIKIARDLYQKDIPLLEITLDRIYNILKIPFQVKKIENLGDLIKNARKRLKINPEDPFYNLDLAYSFTLLNDIEKARIFISIADRFSQNNPIIKRTISRFILHSEKDPEKAVEFIRKSLKTNKSLSLVSTEISLSTLADVKSNFIDFGLKSIKNLKRFNWQYSELLSIFSSLERIEGNKKKARSLAIKGLFSPNENSLAQISNNFPLERFHNSESLQKVSFSYESQTYEYFQKEDYKLALEAAKKWCSFQPFSSKPFLFLSGLYFFIYNDLENAISTINLIKKLNNNEFLVQNNFIFFQLKKDSSKIDSFQLKNLELLITNEQEKATFYATYGLYLIKKVSFSIGQENYFKAFEIFKKASNFYGIARAKVFFLEELFLINFEYFKKETEDLVSNSFFITQHDLRVYFFNFLKSNNLENLFKFKITF